MEPQQRGIGGRAHDGDDRAAVNATAPRSFFGSNISDQCIELFLRAIGRSRSIGRPRMFRVPLDGLNDQVEFVGAVDLARDAVVAVWRDLMGFAEVVQAIDPACGVISHEEHDTGAVFRPGYEGEMIGAEVEHGVNGKPEDSGPHRQRR